ncbi:MAG: hypothetical protein OEV73_11060 [Desulfobulbaceae bacterium]|nr:hypothetical protein [Desulfobulbaceae bacterium]
MTLTSRHWHNALLGALMAILVIYPVTGCTYRDRVAPITLPDNNRGITVGDGLKISGYAITDPKEAEKALGFNAIKAGLLAVRVTFQNDGSETATVNPDQTFLIDSANNAWPILSQRQAAERAEKHVDIGETARGSAKPAFLLGAAGAVAGAAIAIVTGENVGEAMGKGAAVGAAGGAILGGAAAYADTHDRIRKEMNEKGLHNDVIQPGEIAYGFLFFPGTVGEEAKDAVELRLSLALGGKGRQQTVKLDLR